MSDKSYSYEVAPLKVRFTPFAVSVRLAAKNMGLEVGAFASPNDIFDSQSFDSLAVELLTDPNALAGSTYDEVEGCMIIALAPVSVLPTLEVKPGSGRKAMRWQRRLLKKEARRAARHGRTL